MDPANNFSMRNLLIFAALLFCALAANSDAQNGVVWIAANSETVLLEPASLHAGRVYHPAVGGGDMHAQIGSRYPVTVAMAWADEWNAAMRPGAPGNFSFLCVKEHVTSAIYECHLPSERRMIITFRDERRPESLQRRKFLTHAAAGNQRTTFESVGKEVGYDLPRFKSTANRRRGNESSSFHFYLQISPA